MKKQAKRCREPATPALGCLLAVIAGAILAGPSIAPAQVETEYVNQVQACYELRKAGRFQPALANCLRAYKLNRDSRLLYTIGELHEELQQWPEALAAYRHFLQKGGDETVNGRAQARIRRLKTMVESSTAELAIVTSPPGAEVFVDDNAHPMGLTPMSARLRPGAHTIRLILAGYRTVDLAMNERLHDSEVDGDFSVSSTRRPAGRRPELLSTKANVFLADGAVVVKRGWVRP